MRFVLARELREGDFIWCPEYKGQITYSPEYKSEEVVRVSLGPDEMCKIFLKHREEEVFCNSFSRVVLVSRLWPEGKSERQILYEIRMLTPDYIFDGGIPGPDFSIKATRESFTRVRDAIDDYFMGLPAETSKP